MLLSLKALAGSFTTELRRVCYLLQNTKAPRPSGRGWSCMSKAVKSRALSHKPNAKGDQSRSMGAELGAGDPASPEESWRGHGPQGR